NSFGNTADWISIANGYQTNPVGTAPPSGIQLITPLQSAVASLDDQSQQIVKAQYASAELSDGVSTGELNTLGQIRARSLALDTRIQQLASDSFSSDVNQQTEMAVLGKINAATLLQLRSQQDTNQILSAAALHQMLTAKEQFDQQKRALNQAIYF